MQIRDTLKEQNLFL